MYSASKYKDAVAITHTLHQAGVLSFFLSSLLGGVAINAEASKLVSAGL